LRRFLSPVGTKAGQAADFIGFFCATRARSEDDVKGLIGKKIGMTQVFNEEGNLVPVTVIDVNTCQVVGKRTPEKDQYSAVTLGFGEVREKVLTKAQRGFFKKNNAPLRRHLKEFRVTPEDAAKFNVGDTVKADMFTKGQLVDVTGTTKGRGFQGVVKRHGFGGGPNTHGNTKHRRPGSVGPGTDPSRVIKGKRMPGHYGNEQHTQIGLRVEKVDAERHLIYVRGAVAGPTNGVVLVRKQG
jgi:large subunit ribosomal protein L3